jgi:hypothetical protein
MKKIGKILTADPANETACNSLAPLRANAVPRDPLDLILSSSTSSPAASPEAAVAPVAAAAPVMSC